MSAANRRLRPIHLLLALPLCALGLAPLQAQQSGGEVRMSKFFQVDVGTKKVVGPAPHVPGTLHLDLASVTVDQPQYWPNENVYLKVLVPGRAGTGFVATLQKRDANAQQIKGKLDAGGVAVLTVMSGEKKKLELGEYRIDVRGDDNRSYGNATFAVVEGTLGAVSLAHEFKQVTGVDGLEREKGAWFMGNASGAGKRWGNGLNFKNELRVANQPFHGHVECISRCMLPGCNGVQAGPGMALDTKDGKVAGVMDVGGHSGPFQIEFVTPKGSIRHQFEGSSHVERDMVQASGGVTWVHRAGLAPYEKTTQVPGRQIFVEKERGTDDPFEVESVIAEGGRINVRVKKAVKAPMIVTWSTQSDGSFKASQVPTKGDLKGGETLSLDVAMPYALVTLGGFVDGTFKEAWVLAFPPTRMNVAISAPAIGAPSGNVKVELTVRDGTAGAAVSGVLEAFDNRVASRSPVIPLGSALGDSIRNTSNSVSSWQDRTGIDEKKERAERERRMRDEDSMDAMKAAEAAPMSPAMIAPAPPPSPSRGGGMAKMKRMAGGSPSARKPAGSGQAATAEGGDDEEAPQEMIREGEKKVVYAGLVRTDASGRAVVDVKLPPQLGRVTFRFVAIGAMDFAATQKDIDVSKNAAVEAMMPRTFVPGAQLTVPVHISNALTEKVTLTVSGAGINGRFNRTFGGGASEVKVPWAPTSGGKVVFQLASAAGKVLDRREVNVQPLSAQRVTYSRLAVASGSAMPLGADESAVVYASPGALMRGIVMNMVTTMASWFGHAEAMSAQVAARAVILSAISRGILDDEGLGQTLRSDLDKGVRDLAEAFFDGQTGLVRPYPNLPPQPLWSAWVSRNLHAAVRTLKADPKLSGELATTIAKAEEMAGRIDRALMSQKFSIEENGGYDSQGRDVIPVEIGGKVVYRVLTDDAVTKWAVSRLMPVLDFNQPSSELAFSKAYDTFRFLRAFQRTGALQYLTEIATALYLQGDHARFNELYGKIARGMILVQEPGMVQGPALLGGVYSTPMAMVRFLELLLLMSADGKTANGKVNVQTSKGTRQAAMGELIRGDAKGTLQAPAGAVVRIDREGIVAMSPSENARALGRAEVSRQQLAMAGEAMVTVTLDEKRDPLEYYAIVAVPSTTAIKQTEDILSDYRGQLIYGQQAMGGSKMQLLAVPFRGTRTMRLLVEGAWPGRSPGVVAIRHIENLGDAAAMGLPEIAVTE